MGRAVKKFYVQSKKVECPKYGRFTSIYTKIVVKHGGKIWYESEYDKGTTFHFTVKK